MRFLFNPITSQFNAAPPREIIYSDTAPAFPIEGTRWVNTLEIREYVFTFDANGAGYWVEVGIGSTGPQGEVGDIGPVGPVGPQGIQGVQGPAATVAVGTVTTGEAGTSVSVSNAGTSGAAVLNFTIPRGAVGQTGAVGPQGPQGIQGVKGDTGNAGLQGIQGLTGPAGPVGAVGPAGTAASVSVGTTTTSAAGTNASVTNSGTTSAAVLNFTVPRGATGVAGPTGPQGPAGTSVVLKGSVAQVANLPTTGNTAGDLYVVTATGDGYVWSGSSWSNAGPIRGPVGPAGAVGATGTSGTAASVSVGTTTTGAAGTNAAVTNSGTTSAAVLNFTVPRGATGANGATGATGAVGPQGPQGIQGVKGDTGAQGPAGPAPAGTGAVVVSNGTLGTPVGYGTANTANTLVQRDPSGNFSAGTITANLTGNASGSSASCTGNAASATKLATTRAINVSGDVTGTAQNFDGSAAITIPTAIALGVIVNDDINATAAIADTKLATIATANKVSNSATTATSANTNFAIVARDANGNFSANQITANLTGTVTGNATNVSGTVAVANGGTGSTTAAGALTNLGAAAATHTHTNATATVSGVAGAAGFMSAADKTKLDAVANNATAYAHPTGDGNLHVPATSTTNNGRVLKAGSTAGSLSWGTLTAADVGAAASSHTHPYSQITDTPYKDGVKYATTAALSATYLNGTSGVGATLTNSGTLAALVVDGSTVAVNDRILVKDQAASAQNGIYTLTTAGSATVAWVLTRATDADSSSELGGAVASVDRGTANGGKLFSTSFSTANTVGSSSCPWFTVIDSAGGTFTGNLTIENSAPQIKLSEADFAIPYWLLASNGSFYVTNDRDATGAWETPHPLQLRGSDGLAQVFGHDIFHTGNSTAVSAWVTKNSEYEALAGDRIVANTSSFAFFVFLPAFPAQHDEVTFADYGKTWGTRNLTIARNGKTIEGLAEDLVCDVAGSQITLRYEGTTWRVY